MQLKKSLMIATAAFVGASLMGTAGFAQLAKKSTANLRGIVNAKQNVAVVVAERKAHAVGGGFLEVGAQCSVRPGDVIEKLADVTNQGQNTVLARRLRLQNISVGIPERAICPGGTRFYTTDAFWDAWHKADQAAAASKAAATGKKK